MLVLTVYGGVAGDRWERRRILLTCDLLLMTSQGVLATLVLTHRAAIWHFVVAMLISGSSSAFAAPARVGMLPTLVPDEQIQPANSLLQIFENTAAIIGPPIAGAIVATSSPGWALAADAFSFALSAACVARLPASRGRIQAGVRVWHDIRTGWREFVARSWLWLMVLSFAIYQATVLPAMFVLGPVSADRHLGGAAAWAVVLSARAVGAAAVGLVLFKWRPRRPLVASGLVIMLDVPFLAALAIRLPLPVVIATAACSSAGLVAADTLWESTLQRQVPSDVLSRVSSYDSLGSIAINPLGFALIGAISGGLGVSFVLWGVILVEVLVHGALVATPSIRGVGSGPDSSTETPPTDLDNPALSAGSPPLTRDKP